MNRRDFLAGAGAALGTAPAVLKQSAYAQDPGCSPSSSSSQPMLREAAISTVIDQRYAPADWQSTLCFPDDPYKGLIGRMGDLRYGHPGDATENFNYFKETVHFRLGGMQGPHFVSQALEAPGVPIIRTCLEQSEASIELTTFATREASEGRVDNVIVEVQPVSAHALHEQLVIQVDTVRTLTVKESGRAKSFHLGDSGPLFMASDSESFALRSFNSGKLGDGYLFRYPPQGIHPDRPARYFFRFPQEGQPFEKIKEGLSNPEGLLASARDYWHSWQPFHGSVTWQLPSPYQNYLVACARNLQQCRDRKGNFTVFHVGPTIYRNFAIVDLNFILEGARYLGYEAEALESLDASWAGQTKEGGVFANGGPQHWKDTGIAPFTIVRQAELSQDWSYFRSMQPRIIQAFAFLSELRDRAKSENSANGRYGLLARGFGDGGMGGTRSELTNTVWALAALRRVLEAAQQQGIGGYDAAKQLYVDLRRCFFAAVPQEMRQHPDGFQYLPMLMKEDPQWSAPDEWDRPRPQNAQYALSQAIYPGLIFGTDDPVVKGHISLMQACTQEDIPAETGWIEHEGLWTYNASFVAHVYLWAGLRDLANATFHGFLNHASPLYCWREEQPLRQSAVARYIGDMPHNWASAETVRYLRHMLALEDGTSLRLLAGIGAPQLVSEQPWRIGQSPTRFGRVSMDLEKTAEGWRLNFERVSGPDPEEVRLPRQLADTHRFIGLSAGSGETAGDDVLVQPQTRKWSATWR
jgi:hypothetical protein